MTPRMLRTTRRLPTETLELERFLELDGQGLPSYDSPVDIEANVLEYDAAHFAKGAEFVIAADGSRLATPLTLYVKGGAPEPPREQDRVTLGDGRRFIVAEAKSVSGLRRSRTEPDHYRARCAVE